MPKISLPQKNLVLDVALNANLMKALLAAGTPVASSCIGDGICGKCRMKVDAVPGFNQLTAIKPVGELERETLRRNGAAPDERLSCQVSVTTDLTVETSYW